MISKVDRHHRGRVAARYVFSIVLAASAAACADTLPDQDLRILDAVPVAKVSADILWQEYEANAEAANARYWGKAVEVTGEVTSADSDGIDAYVLFGQTEDFGVRANALDDQAAAIVAAADVGERLTLKCFCAGLDGHVILKSCVLPR
jgi:hypothetical protein